MVYTCCVPECNTGYRSAKNVEKIAMFRFPSDEEFCRKWIKAIPRKNFNVTNSTRICAKHFTEDDFETTSTDQCKSRQQKRDQALLKRLRLKSTALPHVFPGLPKYLSKAPAHKRTSGATSSARFEKENIQIQRENDKFIEMDKISDLIDLKNKLCDAILPSNYIKVENEHAICFRYILSPNVDNAAPKLMASVNVSGNLVVKAFVASVPLPKSRYQHLMSQHAITKLSELCNILAFCKSLSEDLQSGSIDDQNSITLAISALKTVKENRFDENDDASCMLLVSFIIEQLQLMQLPKSGCRYSPELITLSFLWKLSSTTLYKQLSRFFILPSIRRLQQLSVDFGVEMGKVDVQYLQQRTAGFSPGEKTVVLLIDEVYTAQRVEYSNESFIGLTDDGHAAKTVLTFMVQSVCKNYKDVVCLIPVEKLDTKFLRFYFDLVMKALNDIFFVAAVSVDNHICNR